MPNDSLQRLHILDAAVGRVHLTRALRRLIDLHEIRVVAPILRLLDARRDLVAPLEISNCVIAVLIGDLRIRVVEQRDLLAVRGLEHDLLTACVDALHRARDLSGLRLRGTAKHAPEPAELRAGGGERECGNECEAATGNWR